MEARPLPVTHISMNLGKNLGSLRPSCAAPHSRRRSQQTSTTIAAIQVTPQKVNPTPGDPLTHISMNLVKYLGSLRLNHSSASTSPMP
jgi:hypothetical protein